MCRLRENAMRLAASGLPLAVAGEPGTGRRTLAEYLNTVRQELLGGAVFSIECSAMGAKPFQAILPSATAHNVVIYDGELLSKEQRAELSAGIGARRLRVIIVSTNRETDGDGEKRATADALDHHIGSTALTLPPLRERGVDLEKWADYFLLRSSQRLSVRPPRLSADALAALRRQRWPGNLIELEAVLSRATCLTAKTTFDAEDIGLPSSAKGEPVFVPLSDAVDRFKADYIGRALAHFSGNRTRTAAALSVDVRTIFRMIRAGGVSGRVSGDEPE